MKKVSLQSLVSFIDSMNAQGSATQEILEVRDEIVAELNKGKAKADATQAEYAEIWDAVTNALRSATDPVTAQELADETGFSKGKIVYGLSRLWKDEVERIEGKVNAYTLKA